MNPKNNLEHDLSLETPASSQPQRHHGKSKCNALGARPASDTSTAMSTAKAIAKAPVTFAATHPKFMKRYALPLALTTLSGPLLSILPLGPLGPILAFVAVAWGRFKIRQVFMGGGYTLLHATGMAGVQGQALSLLGIVGLEATGSQRLRDTAVEAIVESNVGIRAQIVGLAIAVLSSTTSRFGALGSMLGSRSMSLLFNELRSFAIFHGLRWAATNLQGLWLTLCASSDVVKASFLSHLLQQKDGKKCVQVDDNKRMQWACDTLEKVATQIPQFPVEAVAPELAAILKAWDQEKGLEMASREAFDEWVEIDRNDNNLWASISYNKYENMASSTADLAEYADKPTFEDFSHHRSRLAYHEWTTPEDFSHRRSQAENAQDLERVARQTFEKSGMSAERIHTALGEIGLKDRPWRMEVEEMHSEEDDDDDDSIEVIDLGDL
ncbi:uncharacterized protein N0V89_004349 [Didymosphaeria variabile]|uniref:Uncharacterized protein n=1 Tax=Didymosphaeria variabile TaxID=1932322 RepID=A0A9W8XQ92_9PLEO|nr:uncharacterized protein N0V89_004349 [Didymosphaeria variabile]KAJ4356317.1 hypothetical protein N0V89_004349 [Didymosphaeria variabile]